MDESEDEMEDKPIPVPPRREERPISCFVPGSGAGPNMAALARDAASLARDKQRPPASSMISNETYGTMMDLSLPPLPPRGPSRGPCKPAVMETVGRQRSSSDPPNPQTPDRDSSMYVLPVVPPPPVNKRTTMLETKARTVPLPPRPPPVPPPLPVPPPPVFRAPPAPPPVPPPVPLHQTNKPAGPARPKSPKSPTGSEKAPQRPPVRAPSKEKQGPRSKSPHEATPPPTPKPRSTFS
ncbi:arf-GAP with SH3 domain, ANK repeat and PH domain-containing protein 2-like, partial [Etheostoma cragini]|uniref:arf-GAP with SH3 domain, ANK repeat and PH domain-containing protein 2-like n=1 Tax=Etheostoma cragini TaxID=417921 RepID=UPI00155F0FD4